MTHFNRARLAVTALLLLLAFAVDEALANESAPVVTKQGLISPAATRIDSVRAFHGLPYAAPPKGALRWQAPRAPEAWEGVRDGSKFGNRCIQTNPFDDMIWNSEQESEDCLYLSVWTPENSKGLPVMVWIHGGGYFSGSGDEARHDGARLASEGVIVVTLNYRLGVLGFLSHPELTAEAGHSGNYGLLDVVAALRWVRDNIAAFGGDPDRVTIFGESAGSFAVSSLMASPLAKGLFHRAIGQSGAQLARGSRPLTGLAEAESAGSAFGASAGADSIAKLRALPPRALIEAVNTQKAGFWPIIDNHFLPASPNAAGGALLNDVPLLAGWTSAETKWIQQSLAEFEQAREQAFPQHREQAMRHYPADNDSEALRMGITLASDLWLVHATWRWVENQRRHGVSPTWLYLFDQVQASKDAPVADDDPGAAHATDIPFVFDTLDFLGNPVGASDRLTTEAMMKYWAQFAREGNPNAEGLPAWPAYSEENAFPVMRFNAGAKSEPDGSRERQLFLEAVFSTR